MPWSACDQPSQVRDTQRAPAWHGVHRSAGGRRPTGKNRGQQSWRVVVTDRAQAALLGRSFHDAKRCHQDALQGNSLERTVETVDLEHLMVLAIELGGDPHENRHVVRTRSPDASGTRARSPG